MLNMQSEGHLGPLEVFLYVLGMADTEYAARRPCRPIASIIICFSAG